jgi:hypothetical protein
MAAMGAIISAPAIDEAPGVIAGADRINGWAEIAKAGAEFVYATRCYLPIGSEGAKAARALQARGIVDLKQRRVPGTAQFNYVAQRSSAPWSVAPAPVRPKTAPYRVGVAEAEAINAVFPVLARAARFGRPCPTDVQLSERSGVDLDGVKIALAAMVEIGMVRIDPAKAPTLRFITIVATGHKTGLVA